MNDDDVMVEVVIKIRRNGVLALSISEDAAVPKSTVNTLALGLLSWAQYAITTRTYEKTGERNAD